MKKLILFLLLLPTITLAQLELPYSVKVLNPKPIDAWYFESDGTPYDNTAEVLAQVTAGVRYRGMTFNVNGVEYWFGAGTADLDLIIKGGGVTDHGALTGLSDDDHTQYLNNTRGDARYPQLSGTYNNPSWLNQLAWSKITGVPSFLTTETDPVYSASSWFSTTNNSTDWNTAFSWGDHEGLYMPINYETEASDYFSRVSTAGGILTDAQKTAFNDFVRDAKNSGVWSKLDEIHVFAGGFSSAFIKLKKQSVEATNNGFVAGDYSESFGLQGGGSKYISTGFNPTSFGNANTNQSYGVYVTGINRESMVSMGDGATFYLNYELNPSVSFVTPQQPSHHWNDRLRILVRNSSNTLVYNSKTLVDTKATSAANIGNIDVFRYNASFVYTGKLAGYYMGKALTQSEINIVSDLFDRLMHALGRTGQYRNAYYGDSITQGTGATSTANRWASLVNTFVLDSKEVNFGIGGTVLQNTGSLNSNGYDRRTATVVAAKANRYYILYGLNDLRYNSGSFSSTIFQTQLETIIQDILNTGVSASDIIVGSPPYMNPAFYSSTPPFDAGSTIKHSDYRDKTRAACVNKGVRYADVYQYMIDNGGNSLITADGVHPNDAGHLAIATAMTNATFVTGIGDVAGPASSVNNNVALFDGTTGKLIKDSGLTLSGSNTGDVVIQDEGTGLTQRSVLNFTGGGIVAQDNAGNTRTDVSLNSTLNALASYNQDGFLVQTALNTFAARDITGTTDKITVTNGDGVAGSPTITIGADVVDKTIANTYTAGAKQTVLHNGTNSGLRIAEAVGNPSSLGNGDIWLNSTDDDLYVRINGTTNGLTRSIIEDVSTTTYTFSEADRNKIKRFTNAAGCTATVPMSLSLNWSTSVYRGSGAGTLTIASSGTLEGAGTTLDTEKTMAYIHHRGSDIHVLAGAVGSGGGGYTNLTSFVDQTNWRMFYSNGSGDVTELALGADGTYLKSNGASAAPTWETPAGGSGLTYSQVKALKYK